MNSTEFVTFVVPRSIEDFNGNGELVSLEKAISAYKKGRIAYIQVGNRLYALDDSVSFATNFGFLIDAKYYVL